MGSIGKEFIEKTKYKYLEESDQTKGLPQPPLESGIKVGKRVIKLPAPVIFEDNGISLRDAIEDRRSVRQFSQVPVKMDELSFLLWCTQGVREVIGKTGKHNATLRNVPSAGARHALETYLLINNVQDLLPGLYKYSALEHKLEEVNTQPDIADNIVGGCYGQSFVKTCAATFIWAAVPYRMNWRYVERGYRYLYLDAGHVCQNLYLGAGAVNCGVCAIGAYDDDEMNRLLGLDGETQFVIYAAAAGKK